MKKILMFSSIFWLVACSSDLTELNIDTKHPQVVPAATLFSNGQKNLVDWMATPNINTNIFRLLAQQWTETTYTDEANYDLNTRQIPQNFWRSLYVDALNNLRESKKIIEADKLLATEVKANQLAIEDILEVYTFSVLVNTFGDVPYTEALDVNKVNPKYDDAKGIYADLVKRLDADLSKMDDHAESYSSADLIYGGDVVAWKTFAQSLKLKLGMILADADPATAKTIVEQAAPHAFQSNHDNAALHYLSSPPNTNPVWTNLIQSGRKDFVGANTIIDRMNDLHDPRIEAYFTVDANGEYSGGKYAASSNYATFSKPSDIVTDPTHQYSLLDYAEVEFLLAEARERGMNVGGTAESHYNNAIRASFEDWGVHGADDYLVSNAVNYKTATGTYKQKIGTQKWLALYDRGFDAWLEWRRFDFPRLNVPDGKVYADIPIRLTYPINEQTLNSARYNEAATAIGGDKVSTKLFWDKF